MAEYSETSAVHETLAESTVDYVALSKIGSGYGRAETSVTVVNRTGTDEIYVTVAPGGAPQPPNPTVGGANTFVLPAAIGSITIPVYGGVANEGVQVKLISAGAMEYSVESL